MSPPRRSSRLRGSSLATSSKPSNIAAGNLASLREHEEPSTSKSHSYSNAIAPSSIPRTPLTAPPPKPSLEEMHPSKVHQSTAKQPDLGLHFGFSDLHPKPGEPKGAQQLTPSKLGMSSSAFEFKFARPGPQLGPAAQQMMDELREEALRIKAKLAAEREEKRRAEETAVGSTMGRKIAQPKGKAGRFSDVHMAEFRKMDSIADHSSAFRAPPGRIAASTGNLKRSQSRAKLEEKDEPEVDTQSERLENKASAKRARQHITDDASSVRPVSRDTKTGSQPSTPHLPRAKSQLLTSITTPTQASLARAVHAPQSTHIPTMSRSSSKITLNATPRRLTKSATVNNLGGILKSEPRSFLRSPRLDRVKSILRHPSASMKKFSSKQSGMPSLTRSPTKPDLEKCLPPMPTTPVAIHCSKDMKHINLTVESIKHSVGIQGSPSPMRSGLPRSTSTFKFATSQLPKAEPISGPQEVKYPSITSQMNQPMKIEYPSLHDVQDPLQKRPPPSVPSTFTFRSDHTIDFGHSPKGFGSSPGQASVRQVRESIHPKHLPLKFSTSEKENKAPNYPIIPERVSSRKRRFEDFVVEKKEDNGLGAFVPHGLVNKKRRREVSPEEEAVAFQPSPKKQKAAALVAPSVMVERAAPVSRIPSPAKKKVGLSLSRLNMLARPKMRK